MSRLTEKSYCGYDVKNRKLKSDYTDDEIFSVLQALGKLEDIEEELGIDLITLNKLRKADKIYVKFFDEIQEWDKIKIDLRNCKIWYGYNSGKGYGLCQPLSNYGKGFALTKEELENEQ